VVRVLPTVMHKTRAPSAAVHARLSRRRVPRKAPLAPAFRLQFNELPVLGNER